MLLLLRPVQAPVDARVHAQVLAHMACALCWCQLCAARSKPTYWCAVDPSMDTCARPTPCAIPLCALQEYEPSYFYWWVRAPPATGCAGLPHASQGSQLWPSQHNTSQHNTQLQVPTLL